MHEEIAHKIINHKLFLSEKGFYEHSFIYRNTNENIQGYLSQLPIKGKNILTVASSGDHALLSLLNNAKSVETYDINYFAKFYQELKLGGYQILSYEDFVNFFYFDKGFRYEIFEKIINLSDEVDEFWQYLFDYNDDFRIIDSPLFSNFEYEYDVLKKFHPFLDKEYFYKNKTINNLKFYQCNAIDLPKILTKTYDVIMLSSIPNFIKEFHDLKKFKYYLEQLSKHITEDGYIICHYLYNADNNNNSIFHTDEVRRIIPNIEKLLFPSLNEKNNDGVLVYKKNRS